MPDSSSNGLIISADSHVLEPGDLWTKALGGRFGDALPRIVKGFGGHEGTFFYLGRPGEAARIDELVNAVGDDQRVKELVQAGSDPVFRVKLMKADGVAAEVLNPTFALWVPRIPVPVTLHIVTGRVRDPFTYHGANERGEVPRSFLELFGEAAPVLANEFIFGGIFDRFPKLTVFLSEYDAS